ncbi:MAG: MFS transporter [Blastocatellia bacterium]
MNPWRGLGDLPKEIWILFTATLVNRAGLMALPFLVLYLTQQIGLTAGRAGFVLTVYGIGALLTSPLAGRLCDHVGALRIMKMSLLLTGLLLLLFPLTGSFAGIVALTFIWAVVSEAFRPASMTMIVDASAPDQRKQAFAVYRLAANLGMSIGPAVGGLLATVSFASLFLVDGATTLAAWAVLQLSKWPVIKPAHHTAHTGSTTGAAHSGGILADRAFLWLLVSMLPVVMVFFQFQSSMPLFLVRDLHFSESAYGLLFTINTLMVVGLEIPINTATAHWPHRVTLALGALLCGTGFGSLMFVHSFAGAALASSLWTLAEIILFPGLSATVGDIAPPDRRGRYMGVFQMTFSLAFSLGPWLGTQALDRYGARLLWSGAFLCSLLSAAMLSRISARPSHETSSVASAAE